MPVLSCFLIAERRGCSRRPCAPPARAGDDARPDGPTSQTDPWRVTRGRGPVSLVTSTRPSPSDRGTLTTSQRGPNDRSLRANPYPEVTDPFCRLPLSTCSHRPEAADLGDLMRLSARLGESGPRGARARRGARAPHRSPGCSRTVDGCTDAARCAALYRPPGPIAQRIDSKALGLSRRKENSSRRRRR